MEDSVGSNQGLEFCKDCLEKLEKALEDRNFYENMQAYRHSPRIPQDEVRANFQKVIDYIKNPISFYEKFEEVKR